MSPSVHLYFTNGIQNNARVFEFLLRDLPENDPRWDARPDPMRFTLREIVAHLVDFDTFARERFEDMIREELPAMPDFEATQAALHYSTRNPLHQIESLLLSRRELGDWLAGLSQNEWQRRGTRPRVGEFSVEDGAALVLAHDAYHMEQILTWLEGLK